MIKEIIKSTCKFIFHAAMLALYLILFLLQNPQLILPTIGALIALIIWVAYDVCQAISNAASNRFGNMRTSDYKASNLNTKPHHRPSRSSELSSRQSAYSHSNAEKAGNNNLEVNHADKTINLVTPA